MLHLFYSLMAVVVVSFSAFVLWADHQSSGRTSSKSKRRFEILFNIIIFCIVRFSDPEDIEQTRPFLYALGGYMIIISLQYCWYVGFLKGVRRKHVEKLRAKWRQELDLIEEEGSSHAILNHLVRPIHQDRVPNLKQLIAENNRKRKAVLLRKLKIILP